MSEAIPSLAGVAVNPIGAMSVLAGQLLARQRDSQPSASERPGSVHMHGTEDPDPFKSLNHRFTFTRCGLSAIQQRESLGPYF